MPLAHMFICAMFGVGYSAPIRSIGFNNIDKMDSTIGFEMSLIVVDVIRHTWTMCEFPVPNGNGRPYRRYFVDRQTHLF